jgi:cell shape-determining protein MreC
MTPVATATTQTSQLGWFSRAEAWLDSKGKGAWIAAMVLGFIFIWPVGLALLLYMIWSKRMFSKSRSMTCGRRRVHTMTSTGNSAFDSYRDEMIRRLEDEQRSFEDFLQRLREAKDKSEFDQFMDEREKKAKAENQDVKEDA